MAVAAKKVLELLASNKEVRKFLGYVIGIALFLVLLPLIVLIALFGWMSGGSDAVQIPNIAQQQLQDQYAEQYPGHAEALKKIASVFGTYVLSGDVSLAQMLYISSSLPDSNADDTFYADYADCFLKVTAEKSLTDNITEAFGVTFSDEDKEIIDAKIINTEG